MKFGMEIQADVNEIVASKPAKIKVASTSAFKETFSRQISDFTISSKSSNKLRMYFLYIINIHICIANVNLFCRAFG